MSKEGRTEDSPPGAAWMAVETVHSSGQVAKEGRDLLTLRVPVPADNWSFQCCFRLSCLSLPFSFHLSRKPN